MHNEQPDTGGDGLNVTKMPSFETNDVYIPGIILFLCECIVMEKNVVKKSDDEWKKTLTKEEFSVLRKKATEPPFSGKYVHQTADGTYVCAACGNVLFSSEKKFDSGSGWPSFFDTASKDAVVLTSDYSLGMKRIEVQCAKCGGHLGHVFDDGPKPTGQRYCMNSAALHFKEKNTQAPEKK
jgi:peptide-methionine (R)-S-oxide reductase